MALDTHYKGMYDDAVKQLVGTQDRSLLKEFTSKSSKAGEAVSMDAMSPNDEANVTAMSSIVTRASLEDGANTLDTLAELLSLRTPHMDVTRQRTWMSAYEIDWGHTMDKIDKLNEVTDPSSMKLKQGLRTIYKKEDARIFTALSASTVTRGKEAGNTSAVAFPAAQKISIASSSYFGLDTVAEIKEKFENQFVWSGQIVCVISPKTKRLWLAQERGDIQSKDFVDTSEYFRTGRLPQIDGVTFLCHPHVTDYANQSGDSINDDYFYAWDPQGVWWNQWDPLTTEMDKAPTEKFNVIAYMREFCNCARIDDNLVVQGKIIRTT